jgi:hypothetical protein
MNAHAPAIKPAHSPVAFLAKAQPTNEPNTAKAKSPAIHTANTRDHGLVLFPRDVEAGRDRPPFEPPIRQFQMLQDGLGDAVALLLR